MKNAAPEGLHDARTRASRQMRGWRLVMARGVRQGRIKRTRWSKPRASGKEVSSSQAGARLTWVACRCVGGAEGVRVGRKRAWVALAESPDRVAELLYCNKSLKSPLRLQCCPARLCLS